MEMSLDSFPPTPNIIQVFKDGTNPCNSPKMLPLGEKFTRGFHLGLSSVMDFTPWVCPGAKELGICRPTGPTVIWPWVKIPLITGSMFKKKNRQEAMTLHFGGFWPPDLLFPLPLYRSNTILVHCPSISFLRTPWWISHAKDFLGRSDDHCFSSGKYGEYAHLALGGISAITYPHSHWWLPSGISTIIPGLLRTATQRVSGMQVLDTTRCLYERRVCQTLRASRGRRKGCPYHSQ